MQGKRQVRKSPDRLPAMLASVSITPTWRRSMTDAEIQDFVTRFAAAWAARDGNAFLDLWHPEGMLHTPLVGRTGQGKRAQSPDGGADRGGAGFRLAIAGLDLARRRRDHRVADHAQRQRHAVRLARRRQIPHQGRQESRRSGSTATPRRCARSAPARSWSRLPNSESADHAAGCAAGSSLASRWISALLIAACRVGALICAPSRSVT